MRQIDQIAKPLLVEHGFKLNNTTWYRTTGEIIQLVNFQHSSWSNLYFLNTAIDFCDKSLKELGRVLPKEYHCPIRWRSEHVPETKQYVYALDFEKDIPEETRTSAIIALLGYWISYFEGLKTQISVIEKIKDGTFNRNEIYYSFLKEHNLL